MCPRGQQFPAHGRVVVVIVVIGPGVTTTITTTTIIIHTNRGDTGYGRHPVRTTVNVFTILSRFVLVANQ